MAITKNIVNMMGGTIEVQTEQGKGTEVIVRLALRIQPDSAAQSGSQSWKVLRPW